MLKDFKAFISKGNIIDLAVGVVIGGAFQSIITSLVNDIIMPVVSMITGNVDFSNLKFSIVNPTNPEEVMVSLNYGNFITAIVNFLIIALTIFLVVSYLGKLNRKVEELNKQNLEKLNEKLGIKKDEEKSDVKEPETKLCPYCLTEIKYKATRCPHCTSKLEEIK